MNITILKKCVEELKKEKPSLDYVVGVLETLIDMQPAPISGHLAGGGGSNVIRPLTDHVDEEIIPPAVRVGPVGNIA